MNANLVVTTVNKFVPTLKAPSDVVVMKGSPAVDPFAWTPTSVLQTMEAVTRPALTQ